MACVPKADTERISVLLKLKTMKLTKTHPDEKILLAGIKVARIRSIKEILML